MAAETQSYFKIRLNSLHPSEPLPFDVYVFVNDHHVLYLRAGDQITAEKIQNFERKAPDSFYIFASEKPRFKQHVQRYMTSDKIPSKDKAIILRESSLAMVEELFENPDIEQALIESKEIIANFISFIDSDGEAVGHLIGLSSHDFYTYNHSLDVSIYSLGLGSIAGFSGRDLQELGLGSLYHDIGKRNVNVDIICKKGGLNDVEWAQMQKHPTFGLQILSQFDVSDEVKACCFEHHESFLGNGYPQSLQGPEIHPMARIVAICDTYDALTTKRSYNDPMSPTDALNFMKEKLAARYDADLLNAMYSVLFKVKELEKNKQS